MDETEILHILIPHPFSDLTDPQIAGNQQAFGLANSDLRQIFTEPDANFGFEKRAEVVGAYRHCIRNRGEGQLRSI